MKLLFCFIQCEGFIIAHQTMWCAHISAAGMWSGGVYDVAVPVPDTSTASARDVSQPGDVLLSCAGWCVLAVIMAICYKV